jgi:hypothetical protein
MRTINLTGGGLGAATSVRAIWCFDLEYQTCDGERPHPICLTATEVRAGQRRRLWRDELLRLNKLPFDAGADVVVVCFYAAAEMACLLSLGWPLPANVVDLYAEHRVLTNSSRRVDSSLLMAMALRGLPHLAPSDKHAMRNLILERKSWSLAQQQQILDYCQSDSDSTALLFKAMESEIDWPRALLRGRYAKAVAVMERAGVPIDVEMHELLKREWPQLKARLVEKVDRKFRVYDGTIFKIARFANLLEDRGIPWPRLDTGKLDLKDETFKQQALLHPELQELKDLRETLNRMRLSELSVGADGRNRTMLSPFASLTARNQPSTTKFIFGPAKWLRSLIKPPPGYAVAEIDWAAQENGLAAAFSGDELMIDSYMSGDPYLAAAKLAGHAPTDASELSHRAVRDRWKEVVLGVNYGIGPETMAVKIGATVAEARELIDLHKRVYRRFWKWSQDAVDHALLTGEMRTVFGFKRHVVAGDKATSLMNWHMQANGAEMMRIAAIAATEAGIEVCAPIHDAFLIMAPLSVIDEHVAFMRELMSKAGEVVTNGLPIRTEPKVFHYPDRYVDERGIAMWNRIMDLLDMPEARFTTTV